MTHQEDAGTQSLGMLTLGEKPPGNGFIRAGKPQIPGLGSGEGFLGFLRGFQVAGEKHDWKWEPSSSSLGKVGWWEVCDACKGRHGAWNAVKYFFIISISIVGWGVINDSLGAEILY